MSGETPTPVVMTFTCEQTVVDGLRISYKVDIDRAEWNAMSPERRADYCFDVATEEFFENFRYDFAIDDPADAAGVAS